MTSSKTKLGKYFTLGEMTCFREDNMPNDEGLIALTQLSCNVMDRIREKFGRTLITSGNRSEIYNRSIGGAKNSQHLFGQACDFIIPSAEIDEVFSWIIKNIEFDQVILEKLNGKEWIHISYKITGNRKEALTCFESGKYNKVYGGCENE